MTTNAQTSTALRNLEVAAVKTAFDHGFIDIFAGPIPTFADDALVSANTLLCTISNAAAPNGGLTFAPAPIAGVLSKNSSETWSGVNLASGTATFYRLRTSGDTGTSSTTQPRVQGTVGVTNEGINLTQGTALQAGTVTPLASYTYELPTF